MKHQITWYLKYGDDIICDRNKTDIEQTQKEFDKLQHSVKFSMEKELHNPINFLYLTICSKDAKLNF
jgi:hypothetical protein